MAGTCTKALIVLVAALAVRTSASAASPDVSAMNLCCGLVDTGDTDINAQRGGPRDPQNIKGGGTRDTGSLAFNISPSAPSAIITAGLWLGTISS